MKSAQSDPAEPAEPARLGALEQQVMEVLWGQGRSTIREIITHLGGNHAYTTIATVLGNLERKGLVGAERQGRSAYYAARHSRDEHAARLMTQALSTGSDRAASMLHFIDTLGHRDAQLLRDYLQKRDRP